MTMVAMVVAATGTAGCGCGLVVTGTTACELMLTVLLLGGTNEV